MFSRILADLKGMRSSFRTLCTSFTLLVLFGVAGRTYVAEAAPVAPLELAREIDAGVLKVPEFKAVADWANKRGIHVWIAGGSAAGLGRYVQAEMEDRTERAAGRSSRYLTGHFDFAYYNIFRSTQDCDIVIDGSPAAADELERFLRESFNYLQGSKSVWEVRLLREARGSGAQKKDALLGSDFLNQNSDSYSTGAIELTSPKRGETRVRDLFAWEQPGVSPFLEDLAKGEVRFYRNPLHRKTSRFIAGYNPEILSAIRIYGKAFQYGAKIRQADLANLQEIIRDFNPKIVTDGADRYVYSNAYKLYQHAQDLEQAQAELSRSGLLEKLITFAKSHSKEELETLLRRQPLLTRPLGKKGKTAAELGLDIVAHATSDYLAYENITLSRLGLPNVFASREGHSGETAVYGDGFYTREGREGLWSGPTIRYRIDPRAREGEDFTLEKVSENDRYIIFQNRAAFHTLDEITGLSVTDYFHLLADNNVSLDDRGLVYRLSLNAKSRLVLATDSEIEQIHREVILPALERKRGEQTEALLRAWVEWSASDRYPQTFDKAMNHLRPSFEKMLDSFANRRLLEHKDFAEFVRSFFRNPPSGHVSSEELDETTRKIIHLISRDEVRESDFVARIWESLLRDVNEASQAIEHNDAILVLSLSNPSIQKDAATWSRNLEFVLKTLHTRSRKIKSTERIRSNVLMESLLNLLKDPKFYEQSELDANLDTVIRLLEKSLYSKPSYERPLELAEWLITDEAKKRLPAGARRVALRKAFRSAGSNAIKEIQSWSAGSRVMYDPDGILNHIVKSIRSADEEDLALFLSDRKSWYVGDTRIMGFAFGQWDEVIKDRYKQGSLPLTRKLLADAGLPDAAPPVTDFSKLWNQKLGLNPSFMDRCRSLFFRK